MTETKIRFVSFTSVPDVVQRIKVKHKAGRRAKKVKTKLTNFARAEFRYSQGHIKDLIKNDGFGKFDGRTYLKEYDIRTPYGALVLKNLEYLNGKPLSKIPVDIDIPDAGVWSCRRYDYMVYMTTRVYKKLLPVKRSVQMKTLTEDVEQSIMDSVHRLLTAVLLFKGKGFADIKADYDKAIELKQKHLTYEVNVKVQLTKNEEGSPSVSTEFNIGKVVIKKVFADTKSLFFCSKCIDDVQKNLANKHFVISQNDINSVLI